MIVVKVAKEQGLDAIGTLTVLELAARLDLIDLRPMLEELLGTTFRISPNYIAAALERDSDRRA